MIKYRVCEYISNYTQKFDYIVPEYALNEEKTALEKVGEIDIQEQLNSYKDVCLNSILRRFLEPTTEIKNTYDPRRNHVDLIELGEAIEVANQYRVKYNLTDDIYENPVKVFEYVKKLSEDNAKSLDIKFNQKEGEKNGKTKTHFDEKIKEDISSNSKQDTQEKP